MTTDVNFSHIAAEGKSVGLQARYFGPQHSLQMGTPISLDQAPSGRGPDETADFAQWADLFYSWEAYKVLIQQKDNTDAAYRYPGDQAETLAVPDEQLGPVQRQKLAEIEKKLGR